MPRDRSDRCPAGERGRGGDRICLRSPSPAWYRDDSTAMRSNQTSAQQAAERWVVSHVNRRARVLIDDTFYVDLMRTGFAPQYGAVWFEKLDWPTNVDPAVVRALPRGWREFDYVISTSVIRSALEENPGSFQQVRLALQHSRLVASFGSGGGIIEVRRVVGITGHRTATLRKRTRARSTHCIDDALTPTQVFADASSPTGNTHSAVAALRRESRQRSTDALDGQPAARPPRDTCCRSAPGPPS